MFRLATPLLLLDGFCLYHAYTHRVEWYWYPLIFIFPGFGSLFYLYKHFYSRRKIENITENVKSLLNTNYELEQLEREAKYVDTIVNRVNLADKHTELGNYQRAAEIYDTCLVGFSKDDPEIMQKALKAAYLSGNYTRVIVFGEKLLSDRTFNKSPEKIAYAWSLYYENRTEEAEKIFMEMDQPYSNYAYRLAFSEFLHKQEKHKRQKQNYKNCSTKLTASIKLKKERIRKFTVLSCKNWTQ